MYEKNAKVLKQKIKEHAFIRNISKAFLPDGTFDIEGNLKLWDMATDEFEKMSLWPDKETNTGSDASYLVFVSAEEKAKRKGTILVAHGGGFNIRTGCEGANVAWEFHKRGYNVAILAYRLKPHSRMESMADMQQAIRLLREKKLELGIDDQIIVMGFSAGAMLAGNCATHYQDCLDYHGQIHPGNDESARPDMCIISYGAMSIVSFPRPFMAEFDESLFGANEEEIYYFATEKHVTPNTPPMFIWQTASDDGRHGMCLATALTEARVPYELHIFDGGVHGLALADGENDIAMNIPHINRWVDLCDDWIQQMQEKEND